LTTSLVYRSKAGDRQTAVETACAMGCDWNMLRNADGQGRRYDLTQGLLLGAAAVAAAGGVTVWFALKPRGAPEADKMAGAGLSWGSTF
jgi:hypothetical protein